MKTCRFPLSILCAAFVLLAWTTCVLPGDSTYPTQIRLSWSASPKNTMTVVWETASATESSVVEYGTTKKLGEKVMGRRVTYPYETRIFHEVVINNLKPSKRYFYRVGDSRGGFSAFSFFETGSTRGKDFLFTACRSCLEK